MNSEFIRQSSIMIKDPLSWEVGEAQRVVSPYVVDKNVEKEKIGSLADTTVPGSYPSLPMQETTTAGNAPNKSSYANVTGKPSGKNVNFHTLFTRGGGNGIDVVVPVESIRAIIERFANTAYGFFLGKRVAYPVVANYVRNTWGKYGLIRSMFSSSTGLFSFQFNSVEGLDAILENVWVKLHGVPITTFSEDGLSAIATKLGTPLMLDSYTSDMCMQSWGMSSYARTMIELQADVELKDNIVAAMPKITGEGYYTCNIRVEYEWKPPRCASCKVFGHVQEECPKDLGTVETKNLKKASQIPKGIPVEQKVGFKPIKQVYQPVSKKPTSNTSVNKKKNMEPTKEVSKSNPFEVLTSVEDDLELGTNGETSNLASQATNSSGSSFWIVDASSPSTTPIIGG
ncbi:retrotransposon protein, putative, ty1-copia subclass [Tanacetum coccineum]